MMAGVEKAKPNMHHTFDFPVNSRFFAAWIPRLTNFTTLTLSV